MFRYFPAKIDLLLGRLRRIEAVFRPALDGPPALELEMRMEAALTEVFEDPAAAGHLIRAHALLRADAHLRGTASLAVGSAPSTGDQTPRQRLVLAIAGVTLRTAFEAWVESGDDADPAALLHEYRSLRELRSEL